MQLFSRVLCILLLEEKLIRGFRSHHSYKFSRNAFLVYLSIVLGITVGVISWEIINYASRIHATLDSFLSLASAASRSATRSRSQAAPTPLGLQCLAEPSADKYLFVESSIFIEGEGKLPEDETDPFLEYYLHALYYFDEHTGELEPPSNIGVEGHGLPLTPSEWGYIGHMIRTTGHRSTGDLEIIATLPYTASLVIFTGSTTDSQGAIMRSIPVELGCVSADGTLAVDIDGEQVILNPGKYWQRAAGADVVTNKYTGHHTVYSLVRNYGWYDRSKIKPGAPSP